MRRITRFKSGFPIKPPADHNQWYVNMPKPIHNRLAYIIRVLPARGTSNRLRRDALSSEYYRACVALEPVDPLSRRPQPRACYEPMALAAGLKENVQQFEALGQHLTRQDRVTHCLNSLFSFGSLGDSRLALQPSSHSSYFAATAPKELNCPTVPGYPVQTIGAETLWESGPSKEIARP